MAGLAADLPKVKMDDIVWVRRYEERTDEIRRERKEYFRYEETDDERKEGTGSSDTDGHGGMRGSACGKCGE